MAMEETLSRIRSAASNAGARDERARQIADAIRALGRYRWVGV
jgi:hypothetical protein